MAIIDKLSKYIRVELLEIVFYIVFVITVTGLIPLAVGLSGRAFSESFKAVNPLKLSDYLGQYVVYYIFIIIALSLPIFAIAKLVTMNKGEHPSELKNPRFYNILSLSFLYDPEQGFLWWVSEKLGFKDNKNLFRWTKSIFRVFIIFILFFSSIYLMQVAFPKQMSFLTIAGKPQITLMQITPLSEVAFSTEPASTGETSTLLVLFTILMGINAYICAKFKLGKTGFFIIGFLIICPILGLSWMSIHFLVYSSSDASLFSTFLFGWLGSSFVLAFSIAYIWILWHQINNSFAKMSEIVSIKEDLLFIGFIIWILILVAYISLEIYLYSRKKKIGEDTYFQNV